MAKYFISKPLNLSDKVFLLVATRKTLAVLEMYYDYTRSLNEILPISYSDPTETKVLDYTQKSIENISLEQAWELINTLSDNIKNNVPYADSINGYDIPKKQLNNIRLSIQSMERHLNNFRDKEIKADKKLEAVKEYKPTIPMYLTEPIEAQGIKFHLLYNIASQVIRLIAITDKGLECTDINESITNLYDSIDNESNNTGLQLLESKVQLILTKNELEEWISSKVIINDLIITLQSVVDNKEANQLDKALASKDWKLISEIRNYDIMNRQPFLEDMTSQAKKDKSLIHNALALETYYHIRINSLNKDKKYYYNPKTERYQELDTNELGLLLRTEYNQILFDNELNKIIQLFRVKEEPNDDYINFNNVCLDTKTFKQINDRKAVFTTKSLPYNYYDYESNKSRWTKPTLTELTLKQILIPGDDLEDTSLYIDVLQRIGASFKRENIHKKANLYLGSGNNGRGILKTILQTVFTGLNVTVRPNKITDDFFKVNLGSTNVLIMDELDKDSFKGAELLANYKDLTGRGAEQTRNIRKQDPVTVHNYGMLWLFSNTAPYVKFNEKAYWRRTDLFTLPNSFSDDVQEDDPTERIYKANPYLDDLIKSDVNGMEWLISRSIYEYKQMIIKGDSFLLNQTITESQYRYDGKHPLRTFLERYVIKTNNKEDRLSNKLIRYHFLDYCIKNNIKAKDIGIANINALSKDVGLKLRDTLGDIDIVRPGGKAVYQGLILNMDTDIKSDEDIDNEYYQEMLKDFLED